MRRQTPYTEPRITEPDELECHAGDILASPQHMLWFRYPTSEVAYPLHHLTQSAVRCLDPKRITCNHHQYTNTLLGSTPALQFRAMRANAGVGTIDAPKRPPQATHRVLSVLISAQDLHTAKRAS